METIEYKEYTFQIEHDEYPLNPRKEWDNLSTFAFFHRCYENESDIHTSAFTSLAEIEEYISSKDGKDAIYLPVFLYSHSGDVLNTTGFSCNWDSGQLGFAFVTREDVLKEYGWKRITKKREKQIQDYIRAEVETFSMFVEGDVHGYTILDSEENIVDSCYGFYGEDHCIEAAKEAIQCRLEAE